MMSNTDSTCKFLYIQEHSACHISMIHLLDLFILQKYAFNTRVFSRNLSVCVCDPVSHFVLCKSCEMFHSLGYKRTVYLNFLADR